MAGVDTFLKTRLEASLLAAFWLFAKSRDMSPSVALRTVVHHSMTREGFPVPGYDARRERRGDYALWERKRRAVIEADGIQPVLVARVSPEFKDAFHRFARSHGRSTSAELLMIVQNVVAAANLESDSIAPPKGRTLRSERITVRFSKQELEGIAPLATDFGGVRPWLVAVVRAQLNPSVPQFAPAALQALYASNREMAALGRTLARLAQSAPQQPAGIGLSPTPAESLEAVRLAVQAHFADVATLCSESTARWRTP